MDRSQRLFIIERLAEYCHPNIIVWHCKTRFGSGFQINKHDVERLCPDLGGILSPEDQQIFKSIRERVNPNNEPDTSALVSRLKLSWRAKDAWARGDFKSEDNIIAQMLMLKNIDSTAQQQNNVTEIRWTVQPKPE